ncbi:MAG: hypothetical protein RID59_19380 [Hoeflea sp.]|jgi:hypothetical protein
MSEICGGAMSTEEDLLRPKRSRMTDAIEADGENMDGRQKAYYGMLASRLESLLQEIETAGTTQEDDLVKRLRALHSEVSRQVGRK